MNVYEQTGDRILEVEGTDLRNASHEKAVQVIKNTGDPVVFMVQSLIQWVSILVMYFKFQIQIFGKFGF